MQLFFTNCNFFFFSQAYYRIWSDYALSCLRLHKLADRFEILTTTKDRSKFIFISFDLHWMPASLCFLLVKGKFPKKYMYINFSSLNRERSRSASASYVFWSFKSSFPHLRPDRQVDPVLFWLDSLHRLPLPSCVSSCLELFNFQFSTTRRFTTAERKTIKQIQDDGTRRGGKSKHR